MCVCDGVIFGEQCYTANTFLDWGKIWAVPPFSEKGGFALLTRGVCVCNGVIFGEQCYTVNTFFGLGARFGRCRLALKKVVLYYLLGVCVRWCDFW